MEASVIENDRILHEIFFEAVKFELMSQLNNILSIQGQEITKQLATSIDEHGASPMLTAIQYGNYEVVVFLIENFGPDVHVSGTFEWDSIKYSNVSPLCAAIISRQVGIINELITINERGRLYNITVAVDRIKSSSISREVKIEVLELMGAAYALYNPDSSLHSITIWREAMRLRDSTHDGEPAIAKTIIPHPSYHFAKAMDFTLEFVTMDELDQLEVQLHFDNGDPGLNIYTQALLMINRILGQSDPEHKKYILTLFTEYADIHHDHGLFNQAISIGMYLMEQFDGLMEWGDGIFNSSIIKTIEIVVASFVELLDLPIADRKELTFANIMTTIDYTFEHNIHLRLVDDEGDDGNELDLLVFDQIDIMTSDILPELNEQESHRFKQSLYKFIRKDYRFKKVEMGNLLHIACCSCTITSQQFPIRVIKLLLELGVDPNAKSSKGSNALHVLASISWDHWSTNITDAIQLMLDSGSHIDQPDSYGLTPLELFTIKEKELSDNGITNNYLQKLVNKVRPLKCLAAKVISQNGIPFDDEVLPANLLPFVNRH